MAGDLQGATIAPGVFLDARDTTLSAVRVLNDWAHHLDWRRIRPFRESFFRFGVPEWAPKYIEPIRRDMANILGGVVMHLLPPEKLDFVDECVGLELDPVKISDTITVSAFRAVDSIVRERLRLAEPAFDWEKQTDQWRYYTLTCPPFDEPAKVEERLIREWAVVMDADPNTEHSNGTVSRRFKSPPCKKCGAKTHTSKTTKKTRRIECLNEDCGHFWLATKSPVDNIS